MIFVFVCILAGAFSAENTDPGFRFQITQKGINYARDQLVPILTDEIKTAAIEDIKQDVDTPLGHVTFELSSIRITVVDISQTEATLEPPSNVKATIKNAMLSLTAHWHYREDSWPHISDSGSVDVSASQISVAIDILIDTTSKGEPHVQPTSCSFNIGSLDVTFHGGASWLYNLFKSSIEDSLKDAIKENVCPLIKQSINDDLNQILSTLELQSDIDDFCFIDYTLVQAPFVIKDALFVNGKGEIFSKSDPKECPSPKQTLPETVDSDRMVTLWVTEYTLNSAGFAYQEAGFLQYNLTQADIPDKVPIKMNTSFFKYFVPELYDAYPNKELTLYIYVTKPVTFDINEGGVSGRAEGTITWLVHDGEGLVPAFTLDAQLDLCVNLSVVLGDKSMIYLDLITVEPYIQLHSSTIGNFSVKSLESFLKLSRALIIPFVNGLVKSGIPLPAIDDVSFSGFDFTLQKGYLQIHTDIIYNPSDRVIKSERHFIEPDNFVCKINTVETWESVIADNIVKFMFHNSY